MTPGEGEGAGWDRVLRQGHRVLGDMITSSCEVIN